MKKALIIFTVIILILPISYVNSSSSTEIEKTDSNNIESEPGLLENQNLNTLAPSAQRLAPITSSFKSFFTENIGQVGTDDVKYYIQGQRIWFTKSSIIFEQGSVIELNFQNCNDITLIGLEELSHKSNFFYGNDPDKWCTDVPNYAGIVYENIYDNIDLKYYFTEDGLKYDFLVHPGGDPNDIAIKVEGADELVLETRESKIEINHPSAKRQAPSTYSSAQHLAPSACLTINTDVAEIVDSDLFVYQQSDSDLIEIEAEFELTDPDCYGFELLSDYDRSKTLVIDPIIYSTYLGGNSNEQAIDLVRDDLGDIFIAGNTYSPNFPLNGNPYDFQYNGGKDIFVMKIKSDLTSIIYSTYIGGSTEDTARGFDIDNNGSAYVSGSTLSEDFPSTTNASFSGDPPLFEDSFICVLRPAGNALNYSSFVSGNGGVVFDIYVDDQDTAYTTGYIDKTNQTFTVWFLTATRSNGGMVAASYYTYGISIATNSKGYFIIVGQTSGTYPLGATEGAYDTEIRNSQDRIFVTVIDWNWSNIAFTKINNCTFFGPDEVYPTKVLVDDEDNIIIVGHTKKNDLPLTNNSLTCPTSQESKGFIAKFDPTLSNLLYSTYFNGGSGDKILNAVLESNDILLFTGTTTSTDLPMTNGTYDTDYNGGDGDAFVTILNLSQSKIVFSSYFGGSGKDSGYGFEIDDEKNIYLAGEAGPNFPTTSNSFYPKYNGGTTDAFLLKATPINIDLTVSKESVYRPNSVKLYSNASTFKNIERALTAHFEYRIPFQSNWYSSLLSAPIYINDRFETTFTIPINATLGYYGFRVRYNDSKGYWTRWFYLNDTFRVLNNLPQLEYLNISRPTAYLGETIQLIVEGSDLEDNSSELTFELFYKHSDDTLWDILETDGSQYKDPVWEFNFSIGTDRDYGYYDFHARANDTDFGKSPWIYLYKPLQILHSPPTVDSIILSQDEIYRTEIVDIHVNCSDPDSPNDDLYVRLQYISTAEGKWKNLSVGNIETHWMSSIKIKETSQLGYTYDFRARATDMEANTCEWFYLNDSLKILNNEPKILEVDIPSEMHRSKSISISINASDIENSEDELIMDLEYKEPVGKDWNDDFIFDIKYAGNRWLCKFTLLHNSPTGLYSFRARVRDLDGDWSDFEYWNNSLSVTNSLPEVTLLDQTPKELFRTGTVIINASGWDWETSITNLQCRIYYQDPLGSQWEELSVNYDDANSNWYAELVTKKTSLLGNYSFYAVIQDDEGAVSKPLYTNHSVWVKNNLPIISSYLDDIPVGISDRNLNLTVYGFDIETEANHLEWDIEYTSINTKLFRIEWQNEEHQELVIKPLKNKNGKDDITLILVDADGGSTIKTNVTIIVDSRAGEGAPGDVPEEENVVSKLISNNYNILIILVIIIIIIVVILFVLYRRKKKKAEELQERREEQQDTEVQAEEPQVEEQPVEELPPTVDTVLPTMESPAPEVVPVIEPPQEAVPVPMPAPAEAPMLTDGTIQGERREAGGERRENELKSAVRRPESDVTATPPPDQTQEAVPELPESRTIEPPEPETVKVKGENKPKELQKDTVNEVNL